MATDYSTDTDFDSGEHFAYQRTNLNQQVLGHTADEGVIIRFTQGANNTFRYANAHIGVLI
jgi:hypothetical protein